jgi:hypothetical protein
MALAAGPHFALFLREMGSTSTASQGEQHG